MQTMGKYWIPGTFPTGKVLNEAASGSGLLTRALVNDIYDSYYNAVHDKGILPYQWIDTSGKVHFEARDAVLQDIQVDEFDAAAVLLAIHDLAKSGAIDNKWWDPRKQTGLPDIPDPIAKYVKSIKFIGVLALVGVGLYFAWPYLAKARKRKR